MTERTKIGRLLVRLGRLRWGRLFLTVTGIVLAVFGGWFVGATVEEREGQKQLDRCRSALERERAQSEIPREVELECGEMEYRELAAVDGPGRFLVSCSRLEAKGDRLFASLEIGNPFAVAYEELRVRAFSRSREHPWNDLFSEGTEYGEQVDPEEKLETWDDPEAWHDVARHLAGVRIPRAHPAPGKWVEVQVPVYAPVSPPSGLERSITVLVWNERAPLERPKVSVGQ